MSATQISFVWQKSQTEHAMGQNSGDLSEQVRISLLLNNRSFVADRCLF
jgi:hypothetical protein